MGELYTIISEGNFMLPDGDMAENWLQANVRIALFGLENQTQAHAQMPLCAVGYNGASYRTQLLAGGKWYKSMAKQGGVARMDVVLEHKRKEGHPQARH